MIIRYFRRASALLLLVGSACIDASLAGDETSPQQTPACTESGLARFGDVLRLCGLITPETVHQFNSHDLSDISRLTINSGGGRSSAGIEVGKLIRANGIGVTVETWCLSACAQYILPAATEIALRPDALVGLHHTAYSLHQALIQLEGYDHPIGSAAGKVEVEYYDLLGIEADFLVLPLRNLKVRGLVLVEPFFENDETEIYYKGPNFLLVDQATLESVLGVEVIGRGRVDTLESGAVLEISEQNSGLYLKGEDLDLGTDVSRSFETVCLKQRGSAEMQCKDYP